MEFFNALGQYSFLQFALLAGILASIASGISGTFVVMKRISFISGGIAHSVLGGVGIAYYLGWPPLAGAFGFAILSAILIGTIKMNVHEHEDTIIAALWAIGMAVGVIFMYLSPGYNVELLTFLFGNILLVSRQDLYILAGLDIFLILAVFIFYRQFISICFDEQYSRLRGLKVNLLYIFLLILIGLTIVVLMQVVGLILVIALLTLPAAISAMFTRSTLGMMTLAVILGILFSFGGLLISYHPNLPVGATIIILSGISYIAAIWLKTMITRKKRASNSR